MSAKNIMQQSYPRILDEADPCYGFLDDSQLVPHVQKIKIHELKRIIKSAIINANQKSNRTILDIQDGATQEEIQKLFIKKGKELFNYFVKYCGDPASTAIACHNIHYSTIAKEQFRNRTLQKERMNSGWRYQFIAKELESYFQRFDSPLDLEVSDEYVHISNMRIMEIMLEVLIEIGEKDSVDVEIPVDLIESFGACCREHDLLDENGRFSDPHRLAKLFVGTLAS